MNALFTANRLFLLPLILLCAFALPLFAAGKGEAPQTPEPRFRPLLPANRGPYRRVVSLSPALTEIMFALDAGELLAGRTDWCDWPPEAAAIPSVGGFSGATISLESLRALSPDLVLLSPLMHSRLIPGLERGGIAVAGFDPDSFAAIFETMRQLASLVDRNEAASRLVDELEALLEQVASPPDGRLQETVPSVFYLLQDEPFMTCGAGTFIDELIRRAGGVNVFGDVEQAWPTVSFEQLLVRNPSFILTDTQTASRLFSPQHLAHAPLGSLEAVKNAAIIALDPGALSRPGPRIIALVPILAEALGERK